MFLDIGLGIFSTIFLGKIFQFDPSFWFFIAGILFVLLPDSDFVYFFFKRRKDKNRPGDYKHRDYIHYPLLYLSIGSLLFYLIFGKEVAVLFCFCSLAHFIHDSIAIGWGIKWLFPFSKNNFAFLYLHSGKKKGGLKKLIFSFDEKSLEFYEREHGDKDWIKNIYYKWHPIAVVEFVVFLISIFVLIIR